MRCKNCKQELTIDNIIINETGVIFWRPVLTKIRGVDYIEWVYDTFEGNGDVAFFCKECEAELNINEEDIIKILKGGDK
ncbi:MAG: hypothetical protein RMI01_09775 [Thermodesulfovibrio sp.]|nr:hypothetical protein [Thermodesulfovibrio sp.]